MQTRVGAKRLAIANAGTIPDRGLYGVFLAGAGRPSVRVGELDEEMVFETHVGDVFVLGASSWRVDDITHDRVWSRRPPARRARHPSGKATAPAGRFNLVATKRRRRRRRRTPVPAAVMRLVRDHALDEAAAENLVRYVRDQAAAGAVPDAETIVIERVRDELGDWRVCLLSPRAAGFTRRGAWRWWPRSSMQLGVDVETLWSNDGIVIRFPDVDAPPDPSLLLPDPDEVEALVLRQLGSTAMFAAPFRENAARRCSAAARTGPRAPLWQQRKKAADLLAVAARFGVLPDHARNLSRMSARCLRHARVARHALRLCSSTALR